MPLSEYEIMQESPSGTPVMVKIHSTQRDMTGASLFCEAIIKGTDPSDILEDAELSAPSGNYVLTTAGEMDVLEKTTVRYKEEGLSEDGECITEITFSENEPKSLTITRKGSVTCIFLIEEGKRQISVYNTPCGPLEMCTYATRVDNRIGADGGILLLDYAVELRGMTAQRTKMRLEIKAKK